jgi:1,4-dihydroxy-6-naphthoate synthase
MNISLGFSPCPNDCFMFDALLQHQGRNAPLIATEGLVFRPEMADVEALNKMAFRGQLDVTKLSYHAYAYCTDQYELLHAGSALGRKCGPLLISKREISADELQNVNLRVAIPGTYTTANFLLGLAFPQLTQKQIILFSDIENAVLNEDADAGLIIHENRFTYMEKGLRKIADLGEFWENTTGYPIPLGGIVVRKTLPSDTKRLINRVLRRSIEFAFQYPRESMSFVREHAQEMSDAVMQQHIQLYVNKFSIDLGEEGKKAVQVLFENAHKQQLIPTSAKPVFIQ